MDLEQIKLPEDARNYVTLKLMRANLANHGVKEARIQPAKKDLFAAMLVNALKKRQTRQDNQTRSKYPFALVGKLKKIFRK